MSQFALVVITIFLTLAFEFSNGWHDAANSIATVVSTRVLTPFRAVLWAAFWNFIAAFVFGTAVAKTIGSGMVHIELVNEKVLLAGLLGAIGWNLFTLMMGLPTSSSHALMGGYGGAAVAHVGFRALILGGWTKPVLFIFLSPVIGMALAILITLLTSWIVRRQRPYKVDQWFRRLQLFSAALFSLGHGTNDSQKGMGIITNRDGCRRTLEGFQGPLLGDYLLPPGHRWRHNGGRVAHHQDHGTAHHETDSVWGVRRGDGRRFDYRRERHFRHSRQHHPYHHRCDRRRGRLTPPDRRSLGCHRTHCLGLGTYHSRGGPARGYIVPRADFHSQVSPRRANDCGYQTPGAQAS